MGTHQGDPRGGGGGGGGVGGAIFTLDHFRALCFTISHFFSFLFPSIVNDIHIIGPLSINSSTYEHF
jgi:hypothetical protein